MVEWNTQDTPKGYDSQLLKKSKNIFQLFEREDKPKASEQNNLKFSKVGSAIVRPDYNRPEQTSFNTYQKTLKFLRNIGETYVHPRTYERIISHRPKNCEVSKDEVKRLRKGSVAHHSQINRSRSRTFKSLKALKLWVAKKGNDKRIKSTLFIGKRCNSFKSVWYSGSNLKLGVNGSRRK